MRPAAGLLVTLIVVSLLGGQGSAAPVKPEIPYTDFNALVVSSEVGPVDRDTEEHPFLGREIA